MSAAFKKIYPYLLALGLLAVVATCGDDFSFKNPFGKKADTTSEVSADTLIAEDLEPEPLQDSVIVDIDTTTPSYEPEPATNEAVYGSENKMWRMVIASVPEEEMAMKLASKAGGTVMYIDYLDTYRVVYASYGNLRDAQMEYETTRQTYPEAWLVYF